MDADVIVVGGGISGLATAARLQARGMRTIVLESHAQTGGCAGYFIKDGFAFDVGATTFVDFEKGGLGGDFLEEVGLTQMEGEVLPGYRVWLPDRDVTLSRDPRAWHIERLAAFGDSKAHKRFWLWLDRMAIALWRASRKGIRMPISTWRQRWAAMVRVGPRHWGLARYLNWTMADGLRHFGLYDDVPLKTFLGMLIQDTVHSTVDEAPLLNSSLGITIRGAGLTRMKGGASGFFRALEARYAVLGGSLRLYTRVTGIDKIDGGFCVTTRRGTLTATQVVSSLPIWNTLALMPELKPDLQPFIQRDEGSLGGALVMFLGVPESEVADSDWTHHQVLKDYGSKLGDGNNMFISVSSPGDTASAPAGYRAVMISTHTDLEPWLDGDKEAYRALKAETEERLLGYARTVYPSLGTGATVRSLGTPLTYRRFTQRWNGAVGGVRQTLQNSNQGAVPYDVGPPGFWVCGDTTWPGLGTVACILGSRHVADDVVRFSRKVVRD